MGDNSYGQLGISEDTPYVHKVPITGVEKIITKYNSTFAIDKDGNTYSWGDNTYKQLDMKLKTYIHIYHKQLTLILIALPQENYPHGLAMN